MSLLTNYPHDKHVPHSRPSVVTMYEGEGKHRRPVMSIRPGSWGSLTTECKIIEAYRADNKLCGPLSIDHIPSTNPKYPDGMWKIFRRDNFMRYADADDIHKLAQLVRQERDGDIEQFIQLPPVLMFSSKGWYDSGLDEAFGVAPEEEPFDPFADDTLDEAFGVAPARQPRQPHRKGSTLAEWSEIILGPPPDNDPLEGAFDEEESADWEEAFS